jgi:hypothetical protein
MVSKPWVEDRNPLLSTLQAMVASKTGSDQPQPETAARKTGDEKLDSLHRQIKPGTRCQYNIRLTLIG